MKNHTHTSKLNTKEYTVAKIANTVAKTPEDQPIVSRLPKPSVDKITKTLDDLQSYIKTATQRELPKIKTIIENLPDEVELVKSNENCSDLTKLIKDREAELTEQDPTRKKIPSNKTINQTVNGVENIYTKYSGGKKLSCANLDWVRDTSFRFYW